MEARESEREVKMEGEATEQGMQVTEKGKEMESP
jgi:hypothetical protein